MKKFSVISIACFLFLCTSLVTAQKTPKAALEAFYKYDRSHSQTFNRNNIIARRQWFSAELHKLLLNELRRKAAYLKKYPDNKPRFGDGLPFQPLQESCDGKTSAKQVLTIRQEAVRGNRAVVTAKFTDPKPCPNRSDVITVGLIRTRSGWVVDDMNYGTDQTLKQELKRKEY
jgi:hypothetical protein